MVEFKFNTRKYSKTHYYREETKLSLGKHLDNRWEKYRNIKQINFFDVGIIPQEYDNVPTEGFVFK
jgi:hypothetical protein